MQNSVYLPEEDSFFMSDFIKNKFVFLVLQNPEIKVLEIGCGSGINLKSFSEIGIKKQNIFSCDINSEAVEYCQKLGFENCVVSDLFEKFSNEKFDFIFFNPPYLPEEISEPEDSKLITTGGKSGNEISIRFLKDAKNFLKQNGKIYLITSSLSEKIDFENLGYKFKLIGERKLFFEKLFLWELKQFI